MEPLNIARKRLLNQRIAGAKYHEPADVVRGMGAVQAQDYSQAIWAIGLRTQMPSLVDVEQALDQRKIVLTWPMRGTIHMVPAEDAHWMLKLLTPRIVKADTLRLKQLELDNTIIERTKTLFYEALQGGRHLSRAALMLLLEQSGISPQGQRGYHLLWYLAQEGLICFGPRETHQQTFVLLDEWVPAPRQLSPEDGLTELARRYFTSHGPATLPDFARWAGLPMTVAKQGLEAVSPILACEKVDDKIYWQTAAETDTRSLAASRIQLLPGFDEYLLGYKDRRDVLAAEHSDKIVPGGNGVFKPMVVADGQVIGTWKRGLQKGGINIVATLFKPSPVPNEMIIEAARQYCRFVNLPQGHTTVEYRK